jgi:hypothetical protein
VIYRPMFGTLAGALAQTRVTFTSKAAFDSGIRDSGPGDALEAPGHAYGPPLPGQADHQSRPHAFQDQPPAIDSMLVRITQRITDAGE